MPKTENSLNILLITVCFCHFSGGREGGGGTEAPVWLLSLQSDSHALRLRLPVPNLSHPRTGTGDFLKLNSYYMCVKILSLGVSVPSLFLTVRPRLGVTNSLLWQRRWALMDCSGAIRQTVVSGEAPASYCSCSSALESAWFSGPLLPPAADWLPAGRADSTAILQQPFSGILHTLTAPHLAIYTSVSGHEI